MSVLAVQFKAYDKYGKYGIHEDSLYGYCIADLPQAIRAVVAGLERKGYESINLIQGQDGYYIYSNRPTFYFRNRNNGGGKRRRNNRRRR